MPDYDVWDKVSLPSCMFVINLRAVYINCISFWPCMSCLSRWRLLQICNIMQSYMSFCGKGYKHKIK